MSRRKKKQRSTAPIYTFAILWLIMCTVTPVFKLGWLIAAVVIAGAGAYLAGRRAGKKAANEAAAAEETEKAKAEQAAPAKKELRAGDRPHNRRGQPRAQRNGAAVHVHKGSGDQAEDKRDYAHHGQDHAGRDRRSLGYPADQEVPELLYPDDDQAPERVRPF